jgi:hypothetical protein
MLTGCLLMPQLPILPASDKVLAAAHEDLSARAAVSPNDLPSCCFFTVVNSRHGGVTAMTVSTDTKHLAGKCVAARATPISFCSRCVGGQAVKWAPACCPAPRFAAGRR